MSRYASQFDVIKTFADRETEELFRTGIARRVPPDGVKKMYTRKPGEVWRLTEAQLDRQLVAAEYLPATGAFISGNTSPR